MNTMRIKLLFYHI